MENYKKAMEFIVKAVDKFENITPQPVLILLDKIENSYLLVQWPESQEYMEKDWFNEEAIFCGGSEDKTGGSAYFIPIKYLI